MDRTLLIVDDSRLARLVLRAAVDRVQPGWRVLEAAGAADAMTLVAERPVDVALLDINMPQTHGLELAARLRAQRPELPLAIVSANAQHAHLARARALDAAFLEKPIEDEALSTFLSGARLRLRRREAE